MTTAAARNTIETLNTFCRAYDLVFAEMGRVQGVDVYWFVDFNNQRRYYSLTEILDKIDQAIH